MVIDALLYRGGKMRTTWANEKEIGRKKKNEEICVSDI